MSEIPAEAVQAASRAIERVMREAAHPLSYDEMGRAAAVAAAPFLAEQARAHMAAHIREVAADSDWGHVNLRKFIQRHDRLHTGDSVVAVMLALADEIAEPNRETYPKGGDQ